MAVDLKDRVVNLTEEDLCWDFRREPYFKTVMQNRERSSTFNVDPVPCYSHDYDLVLDFAGKAEAAFRVGIPPMWHVACREGEERTNGWASTTSFWNDDLGEDGGWDQEPYIVLMGKRIPPHPGMTRYLCAHEYGHVVDYWMCKEESGDAHAINLFDEEYAKLRGLEWPTKYYGPGMWHKDVGELIANDFRVIMCKVEREFWPHPGIPRPENFPKLRRWWMDKWRKYGADSV